MSDSSDLEVYYGTVIFFSKANYGFISWEKNGQQMPDLFVHWSDIALEGYKTLFKGQKVSFGLGENMRGQPKAVNVQILQN